VEGRAEGGKRPEEGTKERGRVSERERGREPEGDKARERERDIAREREDERIHFCCDRNTCSREANYTNAH
jgi:hypothetical protein